MGLKFNTRRELNLPCRFNGAYKFINAENFSGGGRLPFYGGFDGKSSIPDGSIHPQSYVMPQKPGNMASRTDAFITLAKLDANLIPAYNLLFSSSSSISITNAQLDQIVAMLVNAGLTLTSVQAILSGAANGTMSASGSITVTNAQCGAIIDLLAQGNCSMTPNMFLSAVATMESDMSTSTGNVVTPTQIAEEVFDNQDVETGYTLRKSLRLMLSALSGKISGAGTPTVTIRNVTDTKDRIVAGVDVDGNRTSITTDVD